MKHFLRTTLLIALATLVLSGCNHKWRVKVDLAPDEIKAIKLDIKETMEKIRNFKGGKNGFPAPQVAILANDYVKLGEIGTAIGVYNKWLKKGFKSKVIINNLGRLYDQVGEVELAVKQYQRLIDDYADTDYLYDITWAYINAATAAKGEKRIEYRKKAEKYFNAWQLDQHKTDEQTQQAIKKLRDAEIAAKAK